MSHIVTKMSVGDVRLLTGLGAIMNPSTVKPGLDVEKIIAETLDKANQNAKVVQTEQVKPFNEELEEYLRDNLGLADDVLAREANTTEAQPATTPVPTDPFPAYTAPVFTQPAVHHTPDIVYNEEANYVPAPPKQYERTPYPRHYNTQTEEQRGRDAITAALGHHDVSFSLEHERMEDLKALMLVEIDSLIESLNESGTNIERVPTVNSDSPYKNVESVLRILRHKNDQHRCYTLANEGILFCAYTLEDMFDGKKDWLGYKPDLTGWPNNVQMRLRRIQPETGQLVSDVLRHAEVGPFWRVMIELLPNMIIYAKRRKEQHGQPNVFSDSEMATAHANLR